ncbi:hypothetical protein BN129_744 [Cronobacter sakazakii 701]|nr:hypothetical protein BN129_744 [Cronobacter sakazakii 701]
MVFQLSKRGRHSPFLQIIRRRYKLWLCPVYHLRNVLITRDAAADTKRKIETFFDKIHDPIAKTNLNTYIWRAV